MPGTPAQANTTGAVGGQWDEAYILTNEDGTAMDLSTAVLEFVVRPTVSDATQPPEVKVTSSGATGQGYITITGNKVTAVLSPTSTTLLGAGSWPYALWLNPGVTQVPEIEGFLTLRPVAAA